MEPRNNCTESSYFLSCKMTMAETEKRDRRCMINDDVVDTCQMSPEKRHLVKDRVLILDAVYCKIYSLLVQHDGVVYKNPHCAACNGVKINQTTCIDHRHKSNFILVFTFFIILFILAFFFLFLNNIISTLFNYYGFLSSLLIRLSQNNKYFHAVFLKTSLFYNLLKPILFKVLTISHPSFDRSNKTTFLTKTFPSKKFLEVKVWTSLIK
jgi:hypothetical protein